MIGFLVFEQYMISFFYILIVFAWLFWLCHLVWLHLLVEATVVPYIRTQRAAFQIQQSARGVVNGALMVWALRANHTFTSTNWGAKLNIQRVWSLIQTCYKCLLERRLLVEDDKPGIGQFSCHCIVDSGIYITTHNHHWRCNSNAARWARGNVKVRAIAGEKGQTDPKVHHSKLPFLKSNCCEANTWVSQHRVW